MYVLIDANALRIGRSLEELDRGGDVRQIAAGGLEALLIARYGVLYVVAFATEGEDDVGL